MTQIKVFAPTIFWQLFIEAVKVKCVSSSNILFNKTQCCGLLVTQAKNVQSIKAREDVPGFSFCSSGERKYTFKKHHFAYHEQIQISQKRPMDRQYTQPTHKYALPESRQRIPIGIPMEKRESYMFRFTHFRLCLALSDSPLCVPM